jgi:hypothetical protein
LLVEQFSQTAENSVLGLPNSAVRHAEFAGDFFGRSIRKNRPAERLPCTLLKLAADQFQCPVKNAAFLVRRFGPGRFS